MRVIYIIIVFCCYSVSVLSQKNDNLKDVDYSHIWMSYQDEIVGYIDNDFQRFRIRFLSIEQDETDKTRYNVIGKTKVKNNICEFTGTINLVEVRLYSGDNPKRKKAVLLGSYYFTEDSTSNGSGILIGKFTSYVYWNKNNVLFNDLSRNYSDSYHNNQFEGEWRDHRTKKSKKCNWGVDRIPDTKDLDMGAGEFSPDPIFYNKGWETYPCGSSSNYEEQLKIDNKKWW